MATAKKTGRKQHHFVSSTGETIVGLSRRPSDGRWRIIGTQTTFTEADEHKAIEKFRAMAGGLTAEEVETGERNVFRAGAEQRAAFAFVADCIRKNRVWAAEQMGIEAIAWLPDLRAPTALPTFADLEKVWKTFFTKSAEQKRRVLHAVADFRATTGAKGIGDITSEAVIAYRDAVYARGLTGKMQQNIFTRVRRFFTFAYSRAVAERELPTIIERLKRLTPSETAISLDPKPIEVAEWTTLLAAAEGADKAMVLLMLNGAFYVQEVIRLKWSEIRDGCIITHRAKEGRMVRVCALWPETLEALKALPRKGDHLFYSYQGVPLGVKGADKRFRRLRKDAGLAVTSSQLRDGAATAAAAANVNEQLLNLLLGHRSGMNDHYVKRAPQMVRPATEAIRAHYFDADK